MGSELFESRYIHIYFFCQSHLLVLIRFAWKTITKEKMPACLIASSSQIRLRWEGVWGRFLFFYFIFGNVRICCRNSTGRDTTWKLEARNIQQSVGSEVRQGGAGWCDGWSGSSLCGWCKWSHIDYPGFRPDSCYDPLYWELTTWTWGCFQCRNDVNCTFILKYFCKNFRNSERFWQQV